MFNLLLYNLKFKSQDSWQVEMKGKDFRHLASIVMANCCSLLSSSISQWIPRQMQSKDLGISLIFQQPNVITRFSLLFTQKNHAIFLSFMKKTRGIISLELSFLMNFHATMSGWLTSTLHLRAGTQKWRFRRWGSSSLLGVIVRFQPLVFCGYRVVSIASVLDGFLWKSGWCALCDPENFIRAEDLWWWFTTF